MAFASVGTAGTGTSSASGTTISFSTSAALAAGDILLVAVTTDNTTTTDGDSNNHTAASGGTGTWTKLGETTNGNGAAAAGVTQSVWMFRASGTVNSGTILSFTVTTCVDKCCSAWKFTTDGTKNILKATGATNPVNNTTDAGNGFGSAALSGFSSAARLYFRGLGKEANSTTNITVSTNFTAITAVRSRNNASAVLTRGEFRINTSTGETSNPTLAVVGDTAGVFVALEEVTPQVVTPDAFSLTFTGAAPTVTVTNNVTVTPSAFSLAFTGAAPTVTASDHKVATPSAFSLAFTGAAPSVVHGTVVTPSAFSLAFTGAVPDVIVESAGTTVTPGAFSLAFTGAVPTVTATDHKTVTPGAFSLAWTGAVPTVTVAANIVVTPDAFSLTWVGAQAVVTRTGPFKPGIAGGYIRS